MSVEKLKEELAAVKTSNDMSYDERFQASNKMNRIICEELAKARDEGNTNQFVSLLEKYRIIWRNKLGSYLGRVDLSAVNLCRANLRGVYLSNDNLSWANLSLADLSWANLSGADLGLANLSLANLSDANLLDANLRGANLSNANLSLAKLRCANLRGAKLSNANLSDVNLWGANLSDADLSGVKLRGADLSLANLLRANLSNADLIWANLSNVDLRNTITIGADFSGVKDNDEPMTKKKLQAKLANAIKTPDELVKVIQGFLDYSNKNSITKKEDLDILPSLYRAALDVGNNGAKNYEDESVICQPGDAICRQLLTSARLLNEKFPKKEEKTSSSPALEIHKTGEPPVLGSGVEQQRG